MGEKDNDARQTKVSSPGSFTPIVRIYIHIISARLSESLAAAAIVCYAIDPSQLEMRISSSSSNETPPLCCSFRDCAALSGRRKLLAGRSRVIKTRSKLFCGRLHPAEKTHTHTLFPIYSLSLPFASSLSLCVTCRPWLPLERCCWSPALLYKRPWHRARTL